MAVWSMTIGIILGSVYRRGPSGTGNLRVRLLRLSIGICICTQYIVLFRFCLSPLDFDFFTFLGAFLDNFDFDPFGVWSVFAVALPWTI